MQVGEFAKQLSDAPSGFLDALQTVYQSGQLRFTLGSPPQQELRVAADGCQRGADVVDEQVT